MARPKEQMSTTGYQSAAFLDKCLKEKDRVKAKISQQLRDDVLRMLGEEIHTDLTVTNGKRTIQAHRSIFLTRVGSIFPELKNELEKKVTLNNLNDQDLDTLVREVYYVEDVNYVCAYRDTLPHLNGDTVAKTFRENGNLSPIDISEVIQGNTGEEVADLLQQKIVADDQLQDECKTTNEVTLKPMSPSDITTDIDDNGNQTLNTIDSGDLRQNNESRPGNEIDSSVKNGEHQEPQDLSEMIKLSYSLSLPHETCSKLGSDLLRMFLQEIGCDTTLVVAGQEFKAHRCVLAARSTYFEAMFGGLWTESGADKVILEGVTPCAVEQTLLYLYGGVIDIIDPCELTELLQVADMYGLEGLKDVVCFHLKKDSCHFFHKPCPTCESTAGSALTIAVTYRLDDVQDRLLKWINKFFTKLVATKQFATMPDSVLEICCDSLVEQLTDQTVIDTILECHKLTSKMPRVKWAEPVLHLTDKLMDSAIEFTGQHFVAVVRSQRFLQSGKSAAWSVSVLEDIFSNVIDALPPHKACEAYRTLLNLYEHSVSCEASPWGEDMESLLSKLISYSETYMKHFIHKVTLSPAWRELPANIRDRILKSASYVCIEQDLTVMTQPPQLSNKKLNKDDPKMRSKPLQGPRSRGSTTPSNKDSNNTRTRATQARRTPERPSSSHRTNHQDTLSLSRISSAKNTLKGRSSGTSRTGSQKPQDSSANTRPTSASGAESRSYRSPSKEMSPRPNGSRPQCASGNLRASPPNQSGTSLKQQQKMPLKFQSTTPSRLQQTTPSRLQQITPSRLQQTSRFSPRMNNNTTRQSLSSSPSLRGTSRSRLPERVQPSLRPARSTGSLTRSHDLQSDSLTQSRDLRTSQRSVSTANLDIDSWGLRRREFSTRNLDQLVPILEMAFTQPSDSET